jgi:hypothetical protein
MSTNPFLSLSETEITLPRTKAKVRVRTPTIDESYILAAYQTLSPEQRIEKMKVFVFKLIVTWDAKNPDGTPIPLTFENYGFLPSQDGFAIVKETMPELMAGQEGKAAAALSVAPSAAG